MREIIYVERATETKDGKTILSERRYHGLLAPDGSFRLMACCGKHVPLAGSAETASDKKPRKRAA